MRYLVLVVKTVRYLRWQQIYFRIYRKLRKPRITDQFEDRVQRVTGEWKHVLLHDEKIDEALDSNFLNYLKPLNLPEDWNSSGLSDLWQYNVHYFEDLLAQNAENKNDFHLGLLNSWIENNPPGIGIGWEPYPISLRVVNILKAWLGGLVLERYHLESLHNQVSFLSNSLEKHLMGNHYFVNLKALLFAGVIFDNPSWLKIGERGLIAEIPEQILSDGGNFELSPMYHSLMLIDMLDILNLHRAYPNKISEKLTGLLFKKIPLMLKFLESMSHPDGGLAFFNDSVDGIAPTKHRINNYACILGLDSVELNHNNQHVIDNVASGYFCAGLASNKLIFDASRIGPDYLPAHAHADTLSFELSVGKQRVFVNSGISEYGASNKRLEQRKTRSHNTVEINRRDSSQVWGGFRVAGRARICCRSFVLEENRSICLQAAHDGYKSVLGGSIHHRVLVLTSNSLRISDTIIGNYKEAVARYFFHPDLEVFMDGHMLKIKGSKILMEAVTGDLPVFINHSFWHPQFGRRIPNKVVEIKLENKKSDLEFIWD